jgi:hypothetical protein
MLILKCPGCCYITVNLTHTGASMMQMNVAAASMRRAVPDGFRCPITQDVMVDPVMVAESGKHTLLRHVVRSRRTMLTDIICDWNIFYAFVCMNVCEVLIEEDMEINFDTITDDFAGHTYERTAISRWLQSHDTDPKTNLQLSSKVS